MKIMFRLNRGFTLHLAVVVCVLLHRCIDKFMGNVDQTGNGSYFIIYVFHFYSSFTLLYNDC